MSQSLWLCMCALAILTQQTSIVPGYHAQLAWTIHLAELQKIQDSFIPILDSHTFKMYKTMWKMQIDSSDDAETEAFDISLCLIWMPSEWVAIRIFYSINISFYFVQYGIWYKKSEDELCIAGQHSTVLMDEIHSQLKYLTITMSMDIMQINANQLVLYANTVTWTAYSENESVEGFFISDDSMDVTKWNNHVLTDLYSQTNYFSLNATQLREGWKSADSVVSKIIISADSGSYNIGESLWKVYFHQNHNDSIYITEVCMTQMPPHWSEMSAFCVIAYSQTATRAIYEISVSNVDYDQDRDEDSCFELLLDSEWMELINMTTYSTLQLEITVNIMQIKDNYGQIIYKNEQTFHEMNKEFADYNTNDINLLNAICDILDLDYEEILLAAAICDISNLDYDEILVAEEAAKNVDVFVMLMIVFVWLQVKRFWIQEIVGIKSKAAAEQKCAWMKCKRRKADFHLYICKGCRSTYYCGKNHQKKHWKFAHCRQCF